MQKNTEFFRWPRTVTVLALLGVVIVMAFTAVGTAAAQDGEGCPTWSEVIEYGAIVTGTIADGDDEAVLDIYCFEGREGDEIIVEATATRGNLDTLVLLTDVTGEELYARNDDVGDGISDSRLEYTLEQDGPYFIGVTRYDGREGTTSGDFEMVLMLAGGAPVQPGVDVGPPENAFTLDDCPAGTEPLEYNEVVTGTLDDSDSMEIFCIIGYQDIEFTIDLVATSGDLDTLLLLTDAPIEELYARNDDIEDGSGSRNSQIVYLPGDDEVLLIGATRYNLSDGTSAGDFELVVSVEFPLPTEKEDGPTGSTPKVDPGDPTVSADACETVALSELVGGTWISVTDETFTLDFQCDGSVIITLDGNSTTTDFTYDDKDAILTIAVGRNDLVWEEVVIVSGSLMSVTNANNGNPLVFANSNDQ